jgi:phage terminase large subunit-like protein
MWVSSISSPFPFEVWEKSIDPELKLELNRDTYMGLDLNFMRTDAFLITVQRHKEKLAVFLTHWHNPDGLNDVALTGDLAEIARKYRPRALAFDPKTAGHIAPQLARVGIPVAPTTWASTQFSIFCDSALSAMTAGRLTHTDQDLLNRHLQATARRPSSDGGWRIARSASVQDIGAAVALVLAVGHAEAPQAQVSVSVV